MSLSQLYGLSEKEFASQCKQILGLDLSSEELNKLQKNVNDLYKILKETDEPKSDLGNKEAQGKKMRDLFFAHQHLRDQLYSMMAKNPDKFQNLLKDVNTEIDNYRVTTLAAYDPEKAKKLQAELKDKREAEDSGVADLRRQVHQSVVEFLQINEKASIFSDHGFLAKWRVKNLEQAVVMEKDPEKIHALLGEYINKHPPTKDNKSFSTILKKHIPQLVLPEGKDIEMRILNQKKRG